MLVEGVASSKLLRSSCDVSLLRLSQLIFIVETNLGIMLGQISRMLSPLELKTKLKTLRTASNFLVH